MQIEERPVKIIGIKGLYHVSILFKNVLKRIEF